MRRGNQVLIRTSQPSLSLELEQALRPFGLQVVKEDDWPVAGLVDFRFGEPGELEFICPIVALVNNSLQQRKEALERGASLAVTEADVTTLASCLAEMVINLELEPERILITRSQEQMSPELMLLNDIGWNVKHCSGIQRCLEMMETFRPDLLILDLLSADDASALCRIVRADPRWRKLVMVSLASSEEEEEVALEGGSDDVLRKGMCAGKILQRLADRLQRFRPFRLHERDTLTGCLVRRHAAPFLDRLVRLAIRKDKTFSVCMLDIDHFKGLNDNYGHVAGDEVLARLGTILRRSFRQEDVVARWGGEEFLVALYDSTKENAAKRLCQLAELVRKLQFDFDPSLSLTFSAGVAELGTDGYNLAELIELADQALYQSKAEGRNRVSLATSPSREEDVVLVEDDLKLAVLITKLARMQGLSVKHYRTGEEAVSALKSAPPRVCILDYFLPGMNGLEVIHHIPQDCGTRVIMVSGHEPVQELRHAILSGGHQFLAKPFAVEQLIGLTQEALSA